MSRLVLVETASGNTVKTGMRLLSYKNEVYELVSFRAPHGAESTGRVVVRHCDSGGTREFFPSVFGLEIQEIKDGSK